MKKLALTLFVAMFAMTAFAIGVVEATEPPAFGGYNAGWGQNPFSWEQQSGSFDSGLCLWDPIEGDYVQFAPDGTRIGAIVYEPIVIELWVELHMIGTYEATSYQFHRIGNEATETLCFTVSGTVRSNQTNWCGLTPGPDGLEQLIFRHGMYGGGGNIDLEWFGRYGNGLNWPDPNNPTPAWQEMTIGASGIGFNIAKCDHWFQFKGCFELPYHIDDGYYSLTIAGCPVPEL